MTVRVKICGLTREADVGAAVEAGADYLGVDSLAYLSVSALKRVLGPGLCTGCFDGAYPKGVFEAVSRTGCASQHATTDAPTPSSQPSVSLQPSHSGCDQ